jgi:uncharacterized protein (TIGR00106 family)
MTVTAELNIIPLGEGVSVSSLLAPALYELKQRNVHYTITPMSTIFQTESINDAFDLARVAHNAVFHGNVKRVVTTVKIDDRRDVERNMEEKVESLTKKITEQ